MQQKPRQITLTIAALLREHAPMLPEHTSALTHAELSRLDHFLHTAACGQESMGLSYAHGFLTALASGPEQLESAEWLRLVFDDPVFEDGDEANDMLGLALRLFADIERGLRGDAVYRPVFDYVHDGSGATHTDAQHWCRGFASGFGLFSECWTRAARDQLHIPLSLILRLADTHSQPDPAYAQLCDALPNAAESVYRYWLAQDRY